MFAFAKKLVSTIELQSSSNDKYFQNARDEEFGLRVLAVKPDSIASNKKFESWFDYILGINNYEISIFYERASNDTIKIDLNRFTQFLSDLIANNQDLRFITWNAKGGIRRVVTISYKEFLPKEGELEDVNLDKPSLPTTTTSANPSDNVLVNNLFKKIGLSIQLTPLITSTFVWHVLSVHQNSPAYQAGLLPQSDYIVGAQDGLLATGGEDLLSRVVSSLHARNGSNSTIILYVYNHDFDVIRPVTLKPNTLWGGKGMLGCDVGYGLLHRLPEVIGKYGSSEILSGEGDDRFNDIFKDEQLLEEGDFDLGPGKALFDSTENYDNRNVFIPAAAAPSKSPLTNSTNLTTETSPDATNPPSNGNEQYVPLEGAQLAARGPVSSHQHNHATRKTSNKYNNTISDLSSYFDEETKRSKELDANSGNKKSETTNGNAAPPLHPPPPAKK